MKHLFETIRSRLDTIAGVQPIAAFIQFSRRNKLLPKLICLVLSVIFWFYVDSKRISEKRFKLPVRVDMSHEYAVADIDKKYIVVTARGGADDLRNILQGNISVFVKVQNPEI